MEKKRHKWVIDPEKVEKLYKGGLIKEDTYNKMRGYADGGVVEAIKFDPFAPIPESIPSRSDKMHAREGELLAQQAVLNAGLSDQERQMNVLSQLEMEEKSRVSDEQRGLMSEVEKSQAQSSLDSRRRALGLGNPGAEGAPLEEDTLTLEPAQAPQASPQIAANNEYISSLQNALGMELQASRDESKATGEFVKSAQDSLAAEQEKLAAIKADQDLRVNEQMEKVNQAVAELGSQKIDSGRLFANMGTGGKIALGLGLILSGVNGSDTGVKILQQAIDRDIDEQKKNIDISRQNVGEQKGILAQMRTRFEDERQAVAAARLATLQSAELELKARGMNVQNLRAQAEFAKGMAGIQKLKSEALNQFNLATLASNGFQSGNDFSRQYFSLPKEYREQAVKLPDNSLGIAVNKESAKDVTDKLPAFENVEKSLKEFKRISKFRVLPTEEKGRAESLKQQILLQMKNLEKTGALDQGTIEVTNQILGDPNAFFQSKQTGRVDQFLEKLKTDKENFLSQNLVNYRAPKTLKKVD